MSSDTKQYAVTVEGVGKRYRLVHRRERYGRLTESLSAAIRSPVERLRKRPGETSEWFWALADVSFRIGYGEVVGVIGSNGAGKSTMLKIMSRITEPTTGTVTMRGRVGSLLEVGTGFHPELTGRENVFMSGAILGMSRSEISRKFDEIVAFAEVEQFLDTPVKRYSSGMQVRLGFAVAAHLEPDILFIDEVLAVGDLAFQEKCFGKMGEVAGEGRTVVFVSHNMGAIGTLCPVSLWLDGGRMKRIGATADVVAAYVRSAGRDMGSGEVVITSDATREAEITHVRVMSQSGETTAIGECSDSLTIEMQLEVRRRLPGLYAYMEIRLPSGTTVLMSESHDSAPNPLDDLQVGSHLVRATIPARSLGPGSYDIYLNLTSLAGRDFNVHSPGVVGSFRLHDSKSSRGDARPGFFSTLLKWDVTDTAQG